MLIYETLKKDHQHLLGLINQLNTIEEHDDRRKGLIKEIRDEIIPHSRAEEAVFYNPLRTATAAQHVVRHSFQVGGDELPEMARTDQTPRADRLNDDRHYYLRELLRQQTGSGFPEKVTAFRPEMGAHAKFNLQGLPPCAFLPD